MEITCIQMDILISFYIDGDLSEPLKKKVEEHIKECPVCRAKYNIISSVFTDLKKSINTTKEEEVYSTSTHPSMQYRFFKNNLSAYTDNELSGEDNVKIRKYIIGNKKARKEVENTYRIRKLLSDSIRQSKEKSNLDFARDVIKKIKPDENIEYNFNPLISVAFAFVVSVLIISAVVIYLMSLQ
jgi:anti-sigma factor RsiW